MVIGGSRCDHRRSMMVNWAYCTIRFPPSHNRKRRYFYPKKTFNVRVPALSKTDSPIRSFLYYYTPLLLSLLPSCSLSFRLTRTDWKAIAKRTRVSTIVRGEVGEEFAGGRSKLGNGVSRERGCKRGEMEKVSEKKERSRSFCRPGERYRVSENGSLESESRTLPILLGTFSSSI